MTPAQADAPVRVQSENEHRHDHGGCLCDHPPTDEEATPDHKLPEATGGVAKEPHAKKEKP